VTVQDSTVRDYQKNGITAIGTDIAVQISGNTIRGQGPTNGAAENGIQVGAGASGTIVNNQVIDNVWAPDTINDPADAATGILIFAASSVTVMGNTVGKPVRNRHRYLAIFARRQHGDRYEYHFRNARFRWY
jgi:hypothetical protein